MTKRDDKLDSLVKELIEITFTDGTQYTGVLEWDMPIVMGQHKGLPSGKYSIFVFGKGYIFFRKSHVKRVRRWECRLTDR